MSAPIPAVLILFSFALLTPAFADDACRCSGCGCKGGPGWRGTDGACVHAATLTQICGSPPGAPCKQEAAEINRPRRTARPIPNRNSIRPFADCRRFVVCVGAEWEPKLQGNAGVRG